MIAESPVFVHLNLSDFIRPIHTFRMETARYTSKKANVSSMLINFTHKLSRTHFVTMTHDNKRSIRFRKLAVSVTFKVCGINVQVSAVEINLSPVLNCLMS